jgi:transposase
MRVAEVNPRDTSMTRSDCGDIHEMPLSKMAFSCIRCGMQKGRDYNASINMLRKTTAGHAGSHALGDAARAVQWASKSRIGELRTCPWRVNASGEAHAVYGWEDVTSIYWKTKT